MKIARIRRSILALVVVISLALGGCVVGGYGGGYGYDDRSTVGYGVGYYEPSGHDYGGWGPGYHAGPPPRGGYEHPAQSDSHPAYHPASPSRSVPSIPTQSRGGQSNKGGQGGGQSNKGDRGGGQPNKGDRGGH
jgi:hypothetical protein